MVNKTKFKQFLKVHKGITTIGCVVCGGSLLTTILVLTVPDPHYSIYMMNIGWGPQNFEAPRSDDAEGSPGGQCLWVSHSTGDPYVGEHWGRTNDGHFADFNGPYDNRPYTCAVFAHRYDGARLPTRKDGDPFVQWKLEEWGGQKLPSYLSIGKNDDENNGKIMWDKNDENFKKIDETYQNYLMITAHMAGVIAYSAILRFTIICGGNDN